MSTELRVCCSRAWLKWLYNIYNVYKYIDYQADTCITCTCIFNFYTNSQGIVAVEKPMTVIMKYELNRA